MSLRRRVEKILENRRVLQILANIDPIFQSLTLGESGLAGQLDVFPATAARGRLRMTCADQTGDTIVTVTTAAFAAARTITIPDPGANASFMLTQASQTVAGITTFSTAVETGTTGITGSALLLQSLNAMTIQLNDVDALQLDNAAISSFVAATDTAGNSVFIETEDGGPTPTAARAGGLYNVKTGDGTAALTTIAAGAGGALSLITGAGGVQSGAGASGVGGAGGAIAITSGAGGTTDNTGTDFAGAGGTITLTGGVGGAASGAGVSDGGDGGDIILAPGAGGAATGGGAAGDGGIVHCQSDLIQNRGASTTATGAATLTAAQMQSGIIVGTPTADPSNYTTLTGTLISAMFGTTPTTGDFFELTIINVAATGNVIDLVAGSGVTLSGESIVENVTDGVAAGLPASGTWVFINTGSNTWTAHRK